MGPKIIILGGGLWGSMLAYFFHLENNDCNFELYEKNDRLGGEHIWSFHSSDVPSHLFHFIKPLVRYSWDSQSVKFPLFNRKFSNNGYHSILSSDFHESLMKILPLHKVFLGQERCPEDFSDNCIIFDCRNLSQNIKGGWQNFVGLDVTLEEPHGLQAPIIMDATVAQLGGYRFVYYLPFSSHRILIEDTRYTDSKLINVEEWRKEIELLIETSGWKIKTLERTEVGSLIIPFEKILSCSSYPNVISMTGFFHEVTGYSLPDCLRLCHSLATEGHQSVEALKAVVSLYQEERKWRSFFYRMLNHFLFLGSPAPLRYRMLQHFYKLPENVIQRFYSGQTSFLDMVRFFLGKPPLPLNGVLRALRHQRSIS